jgi:hypothetical protein
LPSRFSTYAGPYVPIHVDGGYRGSLRGAQIVLSDDHHRIDMADNGWPLS